MTRQQQQSIRMNIRNFLLTATIDELRRELEISLVNKDQFRADCIKELIDVF